MYFFIMIELFVGQSFRSTKCNLFKGRKPLLPASHGYQISAPTQLPVVLQRKVGNGWKERIYELNLVKFEVRLTTVK